MNKTVEDYLKILYPNLEMSETEMIQYSRDSSFLATNLDLVNREFDKNLSFLEEFGEFDYTKTIVDELKRKIDPQTIISEYVSDIYNGLIKNSYISNNFETFINTIQSTRTQPKSVQSSRKQKLPNKP